MYENDNFSGYETGNENTTGTFSGVSAAESANGYTTYQMGGSTGSNTEPKNSKKHGGYFRKAMVSVSLGLFFGLFAGIGFYAVQQGTGMLKTGTDTAVVGEVASEAATESSQSTPQLATNVTYVESDVSDVVEKVMPAMVSIVNNFTETANVFGQQYTQEEAASGSGIIVGENDSELLIATNNHVVSGATTLTVCFAGSDVVGAEEETQAMASSSDGDADVDNAVSAKIKGTDEENDLAVVAVEKSDIPDETMDEIKIAQMGSSDDLVVGEQVVAIGNALGYGQSVTSGWISALNRSIGTEDGEASGLIQTDAAINPGNSGGALLNMNGEVIGINAAKYADSQVEGMGYAIPISKAEPILEELMNRETRDKVEDSSKVGYMGVKAADLTTEAIQMYNMPAGAFITEVTEGGAADNAGIKKGDIIVKLDGQKVSGKDDLVDKLQYYEAGETIEVVISRANSGEYKEQTVEVTLGSKPSSDK